MDITHRPAGWVAGAQARVSAVEAAALTGRSSKTICRWIASGRLGAVKRGRAFEIALSDLARLTGLPLTGTGTAPGMAPVRHAGLHGDDLGMLIIGGAETGLAEVTAEAARQPAVSARDVEVARLECVIGLLSGQLEARQRELEASQRHIDHLLGLLEDTRRALLLPEQGTGADRSTRDRETAAETTQVAQESRQAPRRPRWWFRA